MHGAFCNLRHHDQGACGQGPGDPGDVVGLSITISFKGLQVYDETELDAETLKALWREAKPVTAECFRRPQNGVTDGNRSPYLKAQFVITKLSESATAEDDASFDGELKMTGAPETWTPKIPA